MGKKETLPPWDDDRTVADMSGIAGSSPLSLRRRATCPGREKEPRRDNDESYTPKERRWAIFGALKAVLLISGAFIVGFAILIALLLLIWR